MSQKLLGVGAQIPQRENCWLSRELLTNKHNNSFKDAGDASSQQQEEGFPTELTVVVLHTFRIEFDFNNAAHLFKTHSNVLRSLATDTYSVKWWRYWSHLFSQPSEWKEFHCTIFQQTDLDYKNKTLYRTSPNCKAHWSYVNLRGHAIKLPKNFKNAHSAISH